MRNEDNEFFILVLGVLAAIILVISWWFTTGGTITTGAAVAARETSPTVDAGDDDAPAEPAASEDAPATQDAPATEDAEPEPEPEPTPEPTPEPEFATVFDAIAADGQLSVLDDLLRDAGLDIVLVGAGPFTVFAPTNDAISQAAASDTTISVIESARAAVLEYHIVAGSYTVDELTDVARDSQANELTTVQGEALDVSRQAGNIVVNASSVVDTGQSSTGNGIVHRIDNVLIPPVAAINTMVDLEPILFAAGRAQLDPLSFATLDRVIEVLATSTAKVTVEGHTDSSGDPLLNQDLSQGRARSVVNYLVANGIDEDRLEATGFGSENPVADNATEAGRALNRRIEFALG